MSIGHSSFGISRSFSYVGFDLLDFDGEPEVPLEGESVVSAVDLDLDGVVFSDVPLTTELLRDALFFTCFMKMSGATNRVVYGAMSSIRGNFTGVESFDDLSFAWEKRCFESVLRTRDNHNRQDEFTLRCMHK